jgi:hypothetical protein
MPPRNRARPPMPKAFFVGFIVVVVVATVAAFFVVEWSGGGSLPPNGFEP